ncbi:hypothetical protein PIB30_029555 [Stylosanthes scabra]|uniref:Rhodanese-like domain-containing protein 4, chloroplastic n=1 Tax=Stylosanthes scabra TaxID=79078 RepID=A0ABU6WBL1_9FABA|nr:hypothetical protein [Stylosanthes scabra]
MEALNVAVANLTPTTSVLSHRTKQPNKLSSHPTISACKVSNFSVSRSHKQTLFLQSAASIFSSAQLSATALTYEEALGQSLNSSNSGDFDANGVVENFLNFASENPLVVFGGVAVFAVPLVLFQILFKKPKPWGVESAKNAYEKLGEDLNAQLLDIREAVEIREVGTPDVSGLGKKLVSIAYKGGGDDDKPVFLKKLALKFKEPENITLFILDKFDGNSELVAQLVTDNGFKAAYAIKDGAEGPRGWMNSGLPWIEPRKALDFSNLTEAITDAIGDTSDGLAVTLGIAAATGLGFLAFTEIETILQVLGSAALVQFASKKLLFAEDRKQTLRQLDEFLNTKVAPKELVDEVKQIGKAFLPESSTVQKAEAISDTVAESKVVAAAEPSPEINSVPETENKDESSPVLPRPQSPYPYYPDFKPPTSPTPSQP